MNKQLVILEATDDQDPVAWFGTEQDIIEKAKKEGFIYMEYDCPGIDANTYTTAADAAFTASCDKCFCDCQECEKKFIVENSEVTLRIYLATSHILYKTKFDAADDYLTNKYRYFETMSMYEAKEFLQETNHYTVNYQAISKLFKDKHISYL